MNLIYKNSNIESYLYIRRTSKSANRDIGLTIRTKWPLVMFDDIRLYHHHDIRMFYVCKLGALQQGVTGRVCPPL